MTMFENWCALNGVAPIPAAPRDVASFIRDVAAFGIERIWSAVCEISRAHYVVGLSDPTVSGPVAAAIALIAPITPPRSWPKEHQHSFARLPYDLQQFLSQHERRQETVIRSAMKVAADARSEAGLSKLPRSFYRNEGNKTDGIIPHPAA